MFLRREGGLAGSFGPFASLLHGPFCSLDQALCFSSANRNSSSSSSITVHIIYPPSPSFPNLPQSTTTPPPPPTHPPQPQTTSPSLPPPKKENSRNTPSPLPNPSLTLTQQSRNFACACLSCPKLVVRCCNSCVSWFLTLLSCWVGRVERSTVIERGGV